MFCLYNFLMQLQKLKREFGAGRLKTFYIISSSSVGGFGFLCGKKRLFSSAKENAKKFCGEKRGVIISQFFLFLFTVLFALQSMYRSFPFLQQSWRKRNSFSLSAVNGKLWWSLVSSKNLQFLKELHELHYQLKHDEKQI